MGDITHFLDVITLSHSLKKWIETGTWNLALRKKLIILTKMHNSYSKQPIVSNVFSISSVYFFFKNQHFNYTCITHDSIQMKVMVHCMIPHPTWLTQQMALSQNDKLYNFALFLRVIVLIHMYTKCIVTHKINCTLDPTI